MKSIALPLVAAVLPITSLAQQTAGPLETIVVTATRTERALDDVAATVSRKTAEELERELARDIRDLVRYEPGVSVDGTDRFGLGGFTIRGIGGNRVLTVLDGVRVADAYSFGPFLSVGRDYVDVDALEALEIVRGPASALYGSDALGGVVAYRTKDARDYLAGERFHVGLKTGYSSADDSAVGTATFAAGGERISGMLLHTRRSGHETETAGRVGATGPTRERADPRNLASNNSLLKLSIEPSDRHRLTFSADVFDSAIGSNVLSDVGTIANGFETAAYDAEDLIDRRRLTLGYTFFGGGELVDRVDLRVYEQSSEQAQTTRQLRHSLADGTQTRRWRNSYFDQDLEGFSAQVDKAVNGAGRHYLIVGTEYWSTDSASLRDGGTTDAATGAPIPEFTALPTRDFPQTQVEQYGLYVQDEIRLVDGRLLLTPSLRLDAFDASAIGDAVYFSGNPGQPLPEDFDDSEVSPKLGLVYRLSERLDVHAQYAEGFKAPPYSDVNVGFTNPIGGYKTISNPELESERSRSTELGFRIRGDFGRIAIAAFRNRYDEFIATLLSAPQFAGTGGVDPADGLFTFQSQNIPGVEIDGVELSGELALTARRNFGLSFALAYADGIDTSTG
jgi:hemoglobin/transferrin/lactoferrin receptor protein